MAVPFRSIDDALANDSAQGSLTRCFVFQSMSSSTAATTGSGYTSWKRCPATFVVPTFTGNAYMTYCRCYFTGSATPFAYMVALETNLGSVAISTGTFSDGSTMPTRTIGGGSSAALATTIPMLHVSASLTATTPTITTTYTDQAGNTGNSCALVLPTNPTASSAFAMQPHLASGDEGIRDVTNITKSAGTVGTVQVLGLLPLMHGLQGNNTGLELNDPLVTPTEMYPIVSGDVISFWASGAATGGGAVICVFQLQAEV